ncbi:MAG: toxin-antitoxin system protein [Muribaculum sp.]
MDVAIQKKNQSFRLSVDLIERLKELAKCQNRSLNNFVETLLIDAAYHTPNKTTLKAMEEVRSGMLRDTPALDMSSIEAMEKSMGL